MNATPDHVVKTLSSMPDYVDLLRGGWKGVFFEVPNV
jgi:hypothetical protein